MTNLKDITEPLTLAGGRHNGNHGLGCAMEVVSFTNGDTVITDFPDCSHPALARVVQIVNDMCARRGTFTGPSYVRILNPEDAIRVIDLGFATIGTSDDEIPPTWLNDAHMRGFHLRSASDEEWSMYGMFGKWFGAPFGIDADGAIKGVGELIDLWHQHNRRETPVAESAVVNAGLAKLAEQASL